MEYIGDRKERAYRLSDYRNELPDALKVYNDIIRNLEIFLDNGIVHGDLSLFNILYFKGRVVVIDFPQAVRIRDSGNYYELFRRDCRNVSEYFARVGIKRDVERDLRL